MNDPQMQLESILALTDSVTRAFVRQNLPFTVHYYSVKKGGLQEMYIGNEEERKQWMMMMLYDVCYEKEEKYVQTGRVCKLKFEKGTGIVSKGIPINWTIFVYWTKCRRHTKSGYDIRWT